MSTIRFLHTADWQIGMTRHFLGPEAQARFSAARLDAVRAIGRLAQELDCAFVVVCGDVFESNQIDRKVVVRALDALRASTVPVFLLPGNHDPHDAASIYRSASFRDHVPEHVTVFETFDPIEAVTGVWLHPAPWPTKRPLEDLAARALSTVDGRGGLHVLVGHGMVDRLSPDAADPALIKLSVLEQAVADGRLHYVALGDRHSVTDVGASGRIWYSGTPEATDHDEAAAGQVLVVTMPAAGDGPAQVERRPVGQWRFLREVVELTSAADLDRLEERLGAMDAKDRTVVKLGLSGTLALRDMVRLDALLDHHRDLFAALDVWGRRSDLAVLPDAEDFGGLGLVGFAADALDELRAQAAGPGEQAVVAQDALALLVRLAGPH